ncbi:MAG: RNA polymerase sigma factor [Bacteroidales bacterium]|nr:RNA polymerase sigma factor [Bacteroidales bacterium]
MLIDDSIIQGCVAGKRSAQSALYRNYAAVMMAICLRYAQNRDEAEDILQEAFLKIFHNIGSYRKEGSFEGWMKRIMINHALNYYRKNRKLPFLEDISTINETEIMKREDQTTTHAPVSAEKLIALIQMLPPGYRMVFNLYVFEEYSHKEISQELNISENTSKTQLLKARRMLRKKLIDLSLLKNTITVNE